MKPCPNCGKTVLEASGQCRHCGAKIEKERSTSDENLLLGLVGGLIAALFGAIIWAVITAVTGYQIGWMAVGVGFLVGCAVRLFGNGGSVSYGIIGALCSLGGCLGGNLISIFLIVAHRDGIPLTDILSHVSLSTSLKVLQATFEPIDLLFYALALYEGYRFSFAK